MTHFFTLKRVALATFIGLFAQSALASMGGGVGSVDFVSDSGYTGDPYPKMIQKLRDLEKAYPKLAEVFDYGKTPKGVVMSGIRIQQIKNPGADAPLAVINGAIHGDEFLGIEDRLAEWVLTTGMGMASFQKFFAQGGELVIIPVMNPDGYIADRRANSHGTDLNRDFELKRTGHAASKEDETKNYTAFLDSELVANGRKLRFTMDYHCCIGAMLVPWAYGKSIALDPKDVPRYDLMRDFAKNILGTTAGTPWEILGYTADGSTMDHFLEKYQNVAVAYEGEYKDEHKYFDKHAAFLERVIDAINDGKI